MARIRTALPQDRLPGQLKPSADERNSALKKSWPRKRSGASLPLLSVLLPIGISFYTFEAINYTVDVYRRRLPQ